MTLPLADAATPSLPLHGVTKAGLGEFRQRLPASQGGWLLATGFAAGPGEVALLPPVSQSGDGGPAAAVVGLGETATPWVYGGLAGKLPEGSVWHLAEGHPDPGLAVLGFCLGGYRYSWFKPPARTLARLVAPAEGIARAVAEAAAVFAVRDLINTPANQLGPSELADALGNLAQTFGAAFARVDGAALEQGFPAVAAVGRGSARPPVVATLTWQGSTANAQSPLVCLCGKGVVFDTGGYDLKPSSGMLRMKKDMGGAAVVLGVARLLMEADPPIRLAVRIGCVENSIGANAMRPSDVIATRAGLSVEIGNTDAEGRLVLADLLAAACEESPSLLIDCATLTGAARVALGPDLPALFSNDEGLAQTILQEGAACFDPVWRLPLWDEYDAWLDSPIAHVNNVSSKPFAGAVIGALFLRRFVRPATRWAHLDLYAWNDGDRPGRPEGGEAQAMRALARAIVAHTTRTQAD